VAPADLAVWTAGVSSCKNVDGIIVTVPHKFAYFDLCATTSDRGAFLKSINTLRRNLDGSWHGDMFDGLGYVKALALKGFELEAWVAIFAPAGTPADIVTKMSGQIKAALDMPETKVRADSAGIELRYLAPAALEALVRSDTEFWGKTIQAAGIKAD
jgi:shikimate dehydrogenase